MIKRLVSSLIALALLPTPVFAETPSLPDPTPAKLSSVVAACPTILSSLSLLQKSDSKTRVYLGSLYERLLSAHVIPLNMKLVRENRLDPRFTAAQSLIVTGRAKFNREFIDYSQSLEALVAIDCASHPADFISRLVETRRRREQLFHTVSILGKSLENYYILTADLLQEQKP